MKAELIHLWSQPQKIKENWWNAINLKDFYFEDLELFYKGIQFYKSNKT